MTKSELKDVVLDYPTAIPPEVTRLLVAAFKALHPNVYAAWERVKLHPGQHGDDPLQEVSVCVFKFLFDNCTIINNMAVVSAFSDMRQVVGLR